MTVSHSSDSPAPDPVLNILKGAREILTPEGAWCQHAQARTASGTKLSDPFDSRAARFCILGALNKTYGAYLAPDLLDAVAALFFVPSNYLSCWNDTKGRRRTEVLGYLDAAIAARESAS